MDAGHTAPRLGVSGRIAHVFLRSQITPLLALVAFLLGVFAVFVTPKEEEPQINVTMANVMIAFPGASSEDVHNLVTVPASASSEFPAGTATTFFPSAFAIAATSVR